MTLGQKLKKLRIDKNLSIKQVSECIGKSIQTVYRYENDVFVPPIDVLRQLAELFECKLSILFDDSRNEKKDIPADCIYKIDENSSLYIEIEKPSEEDMAKRVNYYAKVINPIAKYLKLNNENKKMIDAIITSLLQTQSPDN